MTRLEKQERIFDALQARLDEATQDLFFDIEALSDLSQATAYAAETLTSLYETEGAL